MSLSPFPPRSAKGWAHGAPLGRPVLVCLPRVFLRGRSRRAGAVIPITSCSAVSLRSGCISPLRQLHFGGEE